MSAPNKKRDHLSAILRDLLKVTKVVSLYPESNPLPQMLKRSFAERLVDLVADYGELVFTIERERLLFEAEAIFTDKSKEEALAGLFFSAGLTRLSFTSALTFEEVQTFLGLLKTYLNRGEQSGDLVSLLWEAHLGGISFDIVEDLSLGDYKGDIAAHAARFGVRLNGHRANADSEQFTSLFGATELHDESGGIRSGSKSGPLQVMRPAQDGYVSLGLTEVSDDGSGRTGEEYETGPVENVSLEEGSLIDLPADFFGDAAPVAGEVDSAALRTAFKAMGLDQIPTRAAAAKPDMKLVLNAEWQVSGEDEERIRSLIGVDAYFDQYESTAELCKEMLLQETQMQDFYEVVDICDKVLGELISAGKLSVAGNLLRYLYDLDARIRQSRPLWAEKIKECCGKQAGQERLRMVADAANSNPDLPAAELRRYLDLACTTHFMYLTELVGRLHHPPHGQCVSDLLVLRGRENIHIVAKGLRSNSIETICESIGILGRIGDPAALGQFESVRNHAEPRVRRELVRWLEGAADVRAGQMLSEYLFDTDSIVRAAALAALLDRKENLIGLLELVVNDPRYLSLEEKSRQHILNAYARVGKEAALPLLEGMILRGGLFPNPRIEIQQAQAFEALAHSTIPEAEQLLLKFSRSWRPGLREKGMKSLQRRREVIYGGE